MSKKFTEYSKFDLSNVNKEVLKAALRLFSTKVLHQLMVCRAFTT